MRKLSLILFILLFKLVNSQWVNQGAWPDASVIGQLHGITVDPEGKVWISPFDSAASIGSIPTRLIYVFNPNGSPASFSPINKITVNGTTDTLFCGSAENLTRGMRTDHNGNILYVSGNRMYRINYQTGMGMNKVVISGLNTFPTAPAVDANGNIYIGPVFPGNPILMYDKNFNFLRNVLNTTNSYARTILVSSDGLTLYYCGYTNHHITIYRRINVLSPFDSVGVLLEGAACESITWHPTTGNIWASAGSYFNLPTNTLLPNTWYEIDPITKSILNNFSWNFSIPQNSYERPRGIAFSPDGNTAYIACFGDNSFPPLQKVVFKSIILTVPNGGENWKAGTVHNITWSSSNAINVKIEYTIDNGTGWSTLISGNLASTGSYSWLIPNTPSTNCKVRVSDASNLSINDVSDNVFAITAQKTIIVTSPNGGEKWPVGTVQNITCTTSNIANVKLEYTTNNGTDWKTILSSFSAAPASYSWTVPNTPSTNCKVRISDADNAAINDVSDESFSINSSANITFQVDMSTQIVKGIFKAAIDTVYLRGSFNNWVTSDRMVMQQNNIYTLTKNLNNNTNYEYKYFITSSAAINDGWEQIVGTGVGGNRTFLTGTTDFIIPLVYFDNEVSAISIVSPNGGENWKAGTAHNITWTSSNVANVKIEYTTNSGTNWTTIIASVAATPASYSWLIPNTLSANCKVRINDVSNSVINDISNNVFTISAQPPIIVTSPNGGENWKVGTTQSISWASNFVGNVKIEYTTNNGTTWLQIIASALATDHSYSWIVPNVPSTNCKVRISNADNTAINDVSDGIFSIVSAQANTGSAYFKGTSRIRVTDANPINPASNQSAYIITGKQITVEAWVFPLSLPKVNEADEIVVRPYMSKEPYCSYALEISNYSGSDSPRFFFQITDGTVPINPCYVSDNKEAQIGKWAHLAATYDGSVARLYVDGILVGETQYTADIGAGDTGFYIGGLSYNYYNGLIDEVRLWNVARSQTEIQSTMNSTLAGNETGLVGYWQLDEQTTVNGVYPVTVDKTNNHNDLQVQYGAAFVSATPGNDVNILPEFAIEPLQTFVGEDYNHMINYSGYPLPTVTIVNAPAGMTYDNLTRSLYWSPEAGQTGYNNITLSATNSSGTVEANYLVWVDAVPLLKTDHNNNITLTVFNNGVFGGGGTADSGKGFIYNGENGLMEGNLLIGKSEEQVSGRLYVREFGRASSIENIQNPLAGFDQAFQTIFNDDRAPKPIGLTITQKTYSKSTDPDKNYVIVVYEIENKSGSDLNNIYVGMVNDFDVGDSQKNLGGFDVARKLSYMYEPGGLTTNVKSDNDEPQLMKRNKNAALLNKNYYGITALTGQLSGHFISTMANGYYNNNPSDSLYYLALTTISDLPSLPTDMRSLISTGPYNVTTNNKIKAAFAYVAGSNLNELNSSTDAVHLAFTTIHVTSPNGGENWQAGSTQIVSWTSNNVSNVKIDYTTDNGTNWIEIVATTPANTGSYSWIVPNTPSTNCKVRISDASNSTINDVSDNVFFIITQQAITVLSPNGGENWQAGSQQSITWSSQEVLNVKLEYTIDNDTNWMTIEENIPANSNSYTWIVPNTPSNNCRVRISDAGDALVNDMSDNVFTIIALITNNKSAYFNGEKGLLYVTDSAPANPIADKSGYIITGNKITVEAWVYPTSLPELNREFPIVRRPYFQRSPWCSYTLFLPNLAQTNNPIFTFIVTNGDSLTPQGDVQFTNPISGAWTHLAGTYDGETVKLYINGNLVGDSPYTQNLGTGDTGFIIGGYPGGGNTFHGMIDEVRLWKVARTEQQIKSYMNNVLIGNEAGLAGYWPLDSTFTSNDTVVITPDKSIYHNDLYVHNVAFINASAQGGAINISSPSVTTESVTIYDFFDATLVGYVNPNGVSTNVFFEYGETSSYSNKIDAKESAITGNNTFTLTADIGGLLSGKTYHYRVVATNTLNETRYGEDKTFSTKTYPAAITMNNSYTFGDPFDKSSYKIIGLPGNVNLPLSQFIQSGVYGTDWKAFRDNGEETNYMVGYDGSDLFIFKPGRAFWILSKNAITINQQVSSVPLKGNYFEISLNQNGWTLISNPFDVNVSWEQIKNINTGVTQPIHFFENGNWQQPQIFEPYKGYYFANTSMLSLLRIPYKPTGEPNLNVSKLNPLEKQTALKSLRLKLLDFNLVKKEIEISYSQYSSDSLDNQDVLAPPGDFESTRLTVFNESIPYFKNLILDSRRDVGEGQEYIVNVYNGTNGNLKLVVEGIENFTAYEAYLFDKTKNKFYNLKEVDQLNIPASYNARAYKLLIGTKEFVDMQKEKVRPTELKLYQNYPNPFNPNTTIRYQLPEKTKVVLKLFDILGNEISTLENSEKEAGYYEYEVTGSNLTSGVYFYQLRAGNFTQIKKMILMK